MAGHQIVVELKEVGRVARIYVGGKEIGVVNGQGRVDITAHVISGHKADVAILVSATPADSPAKAFATPTPGKARKHRGLTGDVLLTAMPQGPQVEALAIRTTAPAGSCAYRTCSLQTRSEPVILRNRML
jgi:hypothetical protein